MLHSFALRLPPDQSSRIIPCLLLGFAQLGVSLATGSYNWTRSAASSNQENLIVTSHPPLVRDFAAEFERLWDAFRG